jgi:hypothetical protein
MDCTARETQYPQTTAGAVLCCPCIVLRVCTAVVQYLPNFFFGALLTVFGIEIAGDWLVRSYAKVRLYITGCTIGYTLCCTIGCV